MRDLVIALIVFGTLPLIFLRPYVGVLLFTWVSLMNPHRMTWGFAYDFPFAAVIGGTVLIALVFNKAPKRIPWTPATINLVLFIVWMTITTYFAFFPEAAQEQWQKVLKIQLMIFVTLMVITNRQQLQLLIWIIVISIGFYGVKGGIFALLTAGEHRVWGPEGSFIHGNNEIALALVMTLPLMRYLLLQSSNRLIQWGLVSAMGLCVIAITSSYSRGAILALAGMAFYLWIKSTRKVAIAIGITLAVSSIVVVMPGKWFDRIGTISNYQADESAMGRIYVWQYAINLAKDRPLVGGGFWSFDRRLHHLYAPHTADPDTYVATDAHSIYFKVLGEHGFIGLFLFLSLLWLTIRTGTWLIRHTRTNPSLTWARDLTAMTQVSAVGYAFGGAFLGLSYFDLFYDLVAILVLTRHFVARDLQEQEPLRDSDVISAKERGLAPSRSQCLSGRQSTL